MAKPELGAKRQCQNCGAKFFDLNRDPVVCPKCGTVFQGATARAVRPEVKEDEEEAAPAEAPEVVSLEEADAAEEKAPAAVAEDDIEVEEDESGEDAFLEQEEEGDDDVSGLIDGDIANDEEP